MSFDSRVWLLAIFILTYIGIAIGHVPRLKLNRVGIALLGAIAMMVVSGSSAVKTASLINWPTMFLLFGFFVLSAQLRLSGFYDWIAGHISSQAEAPGHFLFVLMAAAASLSAFVNNDIVCYVFTPVVGATLIRRRVNPVPFLIALALASNIGAAATLIGNAQGILIGEAAHLSFRNYFFWSLVPVAGTLAAAYGLVWRKLRRPANVTQETVGPTLELQPYSFDRRHSLKGITIFAAVIALCFTGLPKEVVVLVAAGIHLASPKFRTEDLLGLIDWPILVLFMSLFVITGTFQTTGYPEHAFHWLETMGLKPSHPLNEAIMTAGATSLMNNAPAVMLLLKILPLPHPADAYVLALANSFGGNSIMTASVANLVVVQQAQQQGITITFRDFARLGIPAAVAGIAILVTWSVLLR